MKEFSRAFYNSPAWKSTRVNYTKSVGGLCERCMAKGIYKPAEIVHHKIWLTPENINDPRVTLSFDNLMAVCRECHEAIHRREEGKEKRYTVDEFGRVTAVE